jgi:cobalt-zinc-cadmium efflux system protein
MHSHSHNHSHDHAHAHAHAHGHSHGHADVHDFSNVNLSFVIAVSANLAFTILEAVYGFITSSMGLLADAGHNLSDVLGLLLAWGAAYLATRKSSDAYSFGFRRTTILAALINAVVLVLAAGFIAFESIQKLFNPTAIAAVPVMIVATIGIFVNAGTALLFMKGSKNDLNMRGAYLHLAYDALISVGVVVAAIIIYFTDWHWVDPVAGLLIVAVIVAGTWGLLRDSVNLIIDAVPSDIDMPEVREYLLSIDGVTEVHDLHIWGMSTRENCLTAHLVMPDNTLWDSEESYAAIGQHMEAEFSIHHVTLQVEKDPDCTNTDCN